MGGSRNIPPHVRILICAFGLLMLLVSSSLAQADPAHAAANNSRGKHGADTSHASTPRISITSIDTSEFPTVRVGIGKSDNDATLPPFEVLENGRPAGNVQAYAGAIGTYEGTPSDVVMLAIDGSVSMQGGKLANAKRAALALLGQTRSSDRVGLVVFGSKAHLVVTPTRDHNALATAIQAIKLTYETALYDGVDLAAHSFPSDASSKSIVLLSDGSDHGSHTRLPSVFADLHAQHVKLFAVGLEGRGYKPGPMRQMAAKSGGAFEQTARPTDLSGLYATLGQALFHKYWLSYTSTAQSQEKIKLQIAAPGFATVTDHYTAPKVAALPGSVTPGPLRSAGPSHPVFNMPRGALGMILAAAPFAALLAWFGLLYGKRRSRADIRGRFAPYKKRIDVNTVDATVDGRAHLRPVEQMLGATDKAFKHSHFFVHLRALLNQAHLPLREVEVLFLMIAAGVIIGGLLALIGGGSIVLGVIGAALGLCVPYLWVRLKARARRRAFDAQLADVMSTISSALKAGHSFNQAIASVAKEATDPIAGELNRVLAEASLGISVDAALTAMSERMGSTDFDFAVTTVNIQRTVGGSLSGILDMVGDTIRNRQQFREKVKALTSMGTASMYVLLGMPVLMLLLLTLINGDYMKPLFHTSSGHMMLGVGAVMMTIGWAICRKVVSVKI